MERYAKRCLFWALPALLATFSCEKVDNPSEGSQKSQEQLVLELTDARSGDPDTRCDFTVTHEDMCFSVETRAISAVTSVANTNIVWGAVTPSGVWSPVRTGADGSGKVYTGKYVNGTGSNNTYYVTNSGSASDLTLTTSSATLTVSRNNPANGTDLVVGKTQSTSANVSVVLEHIFARTGNFTLTTPNVSGLSVSGVTWSIKSHDSTTGIAGTYNINSGAWTNIPSQLAATSVTSSSDYYLIPGDYDLTVSCTVTLNGSSRQVSRTGTVTFAKGKVNNITAGFMLDYELQLSPASATISYGGTQSYTATFRTWLRFGSTNVASFDSVLSSGVTWTSSNTSVATVSNGTATGTGAGITIITARYTPSGSSQLTAMATLTVQNVTEYKYRFVVMPDGNRLGVGASRSFYVNRYTDTYVNGSMTSQGTTATLMPNSDFTWSVVSGSGYVSLGSAGSVTGVSAGTAVVRATLKNSVADYNMYSNTYDDASVIVVTGSWNDDWTVPGGGGDIPFN